MIRSTNAGISAWIDARGRVAKVLERDGRRMGFAGSGVLSIPLCRSASTYARAGDWFPWLCVLFLIAVLGVRLRAVFRK